MQRIINSTKYDTEKAEEICTLECREYAGDFRHECTSLYRTPRSGQWFLAGEGGPMSRWALPAHGGGSCGGSGLVLINSEDAREILEHQDELTTLERYFSIKEA